MTVHEGLVASLGVGDSTPPFRQVSAIADEDLELRLLDKCYYSEARVPCYEFLMFHNGQEAGKFTARIESNFENVREVGNVGIEANRKFYGYNLAYRATKALLPFFKEHGLNSILITYDEGKRSIRDACD